MTLLSLPSDLLTHVLQQEGIGALELCRLECCSTTVRRLIDNGLWKQAFLRVHRPRALGEPSSWKQELKLRRAWSSGWRTLAACAAPLPDLAPAAVTSTLCSAATTTRTRSRNVMKQKLRRFALKIVSTVPLAPPPRWSTLVVDTGSSEPGVFRTINAAMLCCKPYDRILIRPGVYFEQITIDKPVELMGVGGNAAAVIVGTDGPAIEASSMVVGRVANLTLRQQSHLTNPAMTGAVLIKGGARIMLDECVVTSATGHCVVVQGAHSRGFLTHNLICDAKGVGVLVCDSAHAVIADNEVCRNSRAGIAILSNADPHVRGNRIHSGLDSGVLVSDKGRGRIEGNDISHNKRACVAILKGGEPIVHNNRIHHGRDSGVLVCDDGKGVVRDNEIFANHMAGIAIGRGGASRVTGNTIRDSHGGSLCLSLHSKGDISANVIQHDSLALMQVPDVLLPQVRERNTVLITEPARRPQTHLAHRVGYTADMVMHDAAIDNALPRPLPMVH